MPKLSRNLFQCSYVNDTKCFPPKLLKFQLTSDLTEGTTRTGRGGTIPCTDWNWRSIKKHKTALLLTCFLLLAALLYPENRKGEETKELDCLIFVFTFFFPPDVRISFCAQVLYQNYSIQFTVPTTSSEVLLSFGVCCCKDGLCTSENVATPVSPCHSQHLRARHLLCSLDSEQQKRVTSRLINRRPKSQNNCALDSQNGFGLAWGATLYYGKYVLKQCPRGEWQAECVMGYRGFKQRSVWLGAEITAYCVP